MKLKIKATMLREEDCVLFKRGDIAIFLYDSVFEDGMEEPEYIEMLQGRDRDKVVIVNIVTDYNNEFSCYESSCYYDFIFLDENLSLGEEVNAVSAFHLKKTTLPAPQMRIVQRQLELSSKQAKLKKVIRIGK